jgi:holo-[acyl-carrier protein] synthase
MIIGVGIDMIEVSRIAEKVSKPNGFKEKIFSPREIAFCESTAAKDEHFAARFAAKESFLKATGHGLAISYELHEVEIINTSSGKPEILLHGKFKAMALEKGWNKIQVSLSHLENVACAIVIIER